MLRPSLRFVTGQNTVWYDQVYDLLLVRTLYVTTKFMICYWSEHCMLRSTLWFVTGQNTVRYDQVYDLLLVSNCMLRPSLWFVAGQNTCMLWPSLWFVTGQNVVCYDQVMICYYIDTVCYDQVYDLLLVRTLYATTKLMICYWSERCITTKFGF